MLLILSNTCYVIVVASFGYVVKPNSLLIACIAICALITIYLLYEIYRKYNKIKITKCTKEQKFILSVVIYLSLSLFQTEINCYLYEEIQFTNILQIQLLMMRILRSCKFSVINGQNLFGTPPINQLTTKPTIIKISAFNSILVLYQSIRSFTLIKLLPTLFLVSISYYTLIFIYEFYSFLKKQNKTNNAQPDNQKSSLNQQPENPLDLQVFSFNGKNSDINKEEQKKANHELLNFMQEGIVLLAKNEEKLSVVYNNLSSSKLLKADTQIELLQKLKELKEWELTNFQNEKKSPRQLKMSSSISSQHSFGFIWNQFHYATKQKHQVIQKQKGIRFGSAQQIQDKSKGYQPQKSQFADRVRHSQNQNKFTDNDLGTCLKPNLLTYLTQEWNTLRFSDPTQLVETYDFIVITFEMMDEEVQYESKYALIEVCIFPIFQEKKAQMMLIFRDITYRKYINKLKDHNKQKSKTISFVSHEFRTPLNCIITMLEQYEEEQQQASTNHSIKSAINNAKYLLNLSNDLLDLAQLKAGKFTLICSKFNFRELIEECLTMFRFQAKKKGINLGLDYNRNVPTKIYSDKNRIRQIIINLLSNAFKFTTEGQIRVVIAVSSESKSEINIEVHDSGLGIRVEDQNKLMKEFGKINSDESKKINSQGVGLGLVISNIIAKQLSPNLSTGLRFTSQFRQGIEQLIHLNIFQNKEVNFTSQQKQRIPQRNQSKLKLTQANQYLVAVKILRFLRRFQVQISRMQNLYFSRKQKRKVIQQSLIKLVWTFQSQMTTRSILTLCKFYWGNVSNVKLINSTISGILAEELALQKLSEKCIDCNVCHGYKIILMDVEMPCQDGKQTTQNLRKLYDHLRVSQQSLIIIGCSAYESEREQEMCRQSGMNDYLVKPVKVNELGRMLQKYYYQ